MKKIPTIFERDWEGDRSRVINVPHPDCAWVFAGEGVATRKLDGTCCLFDQGKLWKRRELRKGEAAPFDFNEVDHDETTGKRVGWVPVGDGPEDQWHREALEHAATVGVPLRNGHTYELIGPKIQGNPEGAMRHILIAHDGLAMESDTSRDFDGLRGFLSGKDIEGLVFHHPDGRMAKIKLRDFGLKRIKAGA